MSDEPEHDMTAASPAPESERRWHFECPVCQFDDKEAGRLATDTERFCTLCSEDSHRLVALRRWPR